MDDANFSFAEIPVGGDVHSNSRASPEDIVNIGREIWKKINTSHVPATDDAENDRLLTALQADYKDFNTSFPIVLRWMVQVRKFNAKAFERWLMKHAAAKLDTREEFLELQAEYLVMLHREENKGHVDEAFVKRYRTSLVRQLLDEDKAFMKMNEEVEADMKIRAEIADQDRRQKLYQWMLTQRVQMEDKQSK